MNLSSDCFVKNFFDPLLWLSLQRYASSTWVLVSKKKAKEMILYFLKKTVVSATFFEIIDTIIKWVTKDKKKMYVL